MKLKKPVLHFAFGFVAFKDGQKGLYGRIDDPDAGWKGRGLWSTSGDRVPWLMEGGEGSKPRAVHIEVRPDALATLRQETGHGRHP